MNSLSAFALKMHLFVLKSDTFCIDLLLFATKMHIIVTVFCMVLISYLFIIQ